MAKIPLRTYLKEIENLIERGEIEQAIAHARNILQAYPKHIETYRLLGKAFLESQRFAEAADILQRVLSVIPDDFVSQIGISIIREDEGNLDAAIWHMERAYEVQPFNPAVQDELRRLYGRRDGVEPPKIRLTRGALVRMYMRGELYPQAIGEIRAALAEDPQRYDLRVLLARLYHLTGQKNDAAEVSSELITKLPYCYEANRLLAEILPTTNRAEETPKFQQRIYALDPYEAFISPSAPTAAQVPDQAVMIEQFAWEPGMEAAQTPDWTRTVGVEWQEPEAEPLPEWLNTLKPQTETPEIEEKTAEVTPVEAVAQEETPAAEENLVPDWMKEAGWSASERPADEIMAEQASTSAEEEAVLPAEIPAWLQSKAPDVEEQPVQEEAERTDWLENLIPQQETPVEGGITPEIAAPSEELPGWLAELQTEEPSTAAGAEEQATGAVPDWFAAAQKEEPLSAEQAEALPAAELGTFGEEMPAGEQPLMEPAAEAAEIPDWLKELETGAPEEKVSAEEEQLWDLNLPGTPAVEAEPAAELPDWLKAGEPVSEPPAAAVEEQPLAPAEAAASAEPLVAPVESAVAPEVESAAAPLSEMDAAMAWLESLAAKQGADEATLTTAPDQRTETPPEWVLNEMKDQAPVEAAAEETGPATVTEGEETASETVGALPEATQAEVVEPQADEAAVAPTQPVETQQPAAVQPAAESEASSAAIFSDLDASMAWLESLAARQGADEATLVTPREQRTETPPDWLQKEMSAQAEAPAAAPEEPQPAAEEAIPDWLKEGIEPQATPEAPLEATAAEAVPPAEIQAEAVGETHERAPSQPEIEPETRAVPTVEDETALVNPVGFAEETAPEAAAQVPEWLAGIGEEVPASEPGEELPPWEPTPESALEREEKLPDWLQTGEVAQPQVSAGVESKAEEIPDWLKGLEETTAEEQAPETEAAPTPVDYRAAWAPEHPEEPAIETTPQAVEPAAQPALNLTDLRGALDRGNLEKALDGYNRYIQEEQNLPEIIHDLKNALYRYPVDITIWQTLGDAYARNNQLQDAIDAYTKAEELLR